jgi:predicted small secreted protein
MQPEIRLPFMPSRPLVFCLLLAALLLLAACHGTDTGAGHRH